MSIEFLQQLTTPHRSTISVGVADSLVEAVRIALADDTDDRARRIVESQTEISSEHYDTWLSLILEIAEEQHVQLKTRAVFNEYAFEVLDNDPILDMIGGNNEPVKFQIVTVLWKMYAQQQAQKRASGHVQRAAKQAQEDEETILSMVGSDAFPRQSVQMAIPSIPAPSNTSPVDSILRQVVSSPTNVVADVVKQIEQEGNAAWAATSLPTNPHPLGSAAYKAWIKGFVNGAKATLGINDKPASTTKKKSSRRR